MGGQRRWILLLLLCAHVARSGGASAIPAPAGAADGASAGDGAGAGSSGRKDDGGVDAGADGSGGKVDPTVDAPNWPPGIPLRPVEPPWPPDAPSPSPPPPAPPPIYCPYLPPYPGISSLQVFTCDIEAPQPDVCGLSMLNGAELNLEPGQALAIEYRNVMSRTLSRLVLSAERLAFSIAPQDTTQIVLIASGLCTSVSALYACLHNAYHGAPPLYRACPECVAVNVVRELGELRSIEWHGEAATAGDSSFFRTQLESQLGPETGALLYFLASASSDTVRLSYARAGRLLYLPGAQVPFLPPSNQSFANISAPAPPAKSPPSPMPAPQPVASSEGGRGSGGVPPVASPSPLAAAPPGPALVVPAPRPAPGSAGAPRVHWALLGLSIVVSLLAAQ